MQTYFILPFLKTYILFGKCQKCKSVFQFIWHIVNLVILQKSRLVQFIHTNATHKIYCRSFPKHLQKRLRNLIIPICKRKIKARIQSTEKRKTKKNKIQDIFFGFFLFCCFVLFLRMHQQMLVFAVEKQKIKTLKLDHFSTFSKIFTTEFQGFFFCKTTGRGGETKSIIYSSKDLMVEHTIFWANKQNLHLLLFNRKM